MLLAEMDILSSFLKQTKTKLVNAINLLHFSKCPYPKQDFCYCYSINQHRTKTSLRNTLFEKILNRLGNLNNQRAKTQLKHKFL